MNFIFISDTCGPCHALMRQLDTVAQPADLKVRNISTDRSAAMQMMQAGVMSTPSALIGGQWYTGAPAIMQALNRQYGTRF